MGRLEIRRPRWPYLVLASAALGMGGVFVAYLFFWDHAPDEAPSILADAIFSVLALASAFLTVQWVRSFIRNEPIFTLDDEGFTYCPAGVSTGVIRWEDVAEIREITVTVGGSGYGPEPQPALAIVLRSPDAYISRFPRVLQSLFQMREELSGTPLVLDRGGFGKRYAEVRRAMEERLARARR